MPRAGPRPTRGNLISLWERLNQSNAASKDEVLSFTYLIQTIL